MKKYIVTYSTKNEALEEGRKMYKAVAVFIVFLFVISLI